MRRFVKWISIAVLVIVIGAVIGFAYVDRIAKAAIEYGGTYALGTKTELDKASIGIFSGRFGLTGLHIANPEGFEKPDFMNLAKGSASLTMGSLLKDTVEVPQLSLSGIDLNLERGKGGANYNVILENLSRFESSGEPKKGKGFIIRKIEIRDIKVRVDLVPLVGKLTSFTVDIPEITLNDVGSDSENGVLIAELSGTILKAILTSAVAKGGDIIPGDVLAELGGGLGKLTKVPGFAVDLLGNVGSTVGDVGKKAGEAGKEVGEKAGDVLKGIGGVFKKDDE